MPVHAWRGSEFDRAAFSVLFGRSRFKPAKVATKRAGRTGSQRGSHGARLGRSSRECKRHLLISKPFCAPLGPWHVNRRLWDACRRVGKKSPGAPREAGGGQSLSGRNALSAGCPAAFCLCHAFLLLFFQTGEHGTDVDVGWRTWVLSLPCAMLNSMGGWGRIDKDARFCRRAARRSPAP